MKKGKLVLPFFLFKQLGHLAEQLTDRQVLGADVLAGAAADAL